MKTRQLLMLKQDKQGESQQDTLDKLHTIESQFAREKKASNAARLVCNRAGCGAAVWYDWTDARAGVGYRAAVHQACLSH